MKRCPQCGKWMSKYNKHKKCFACLVKDDPWSEAVAGYCCGARDTKGFDRAQMDYHGTLYDLPEKE